MEKSAAWIAVCAAAFISYWIESAGLFIALDNICSLANVMNRLKQHKVCLQLSPKSRCRLPSTKTQPECFQVFGVLMNQEPREPTPDAIRQSAGWHCCILFIYLFGEARLHCVPEKISSLVGLLNCC